jgi:hypothetical protein
MVQLMRKFAKNHAYNWIVKADFLGKIDAIAKSFTSVAREMLAGELIFIRSSDFVCLGPTVRAMH